MAYTIWDSDAIDGPFKMESGNIFQKENKYLKRGQSSPPLSHT